MTSALFAKYPLVELDDEATAEFQATRLTPTMTYRPSSANMESILNVPFQMLDHGSLAVLDYMGNDSSIVQAARTSYGKGTKSVLEDASLIAYLLRHRHTTPFEMCEIKFHLKMPIFVMRQWIRHRTANVNEYSARYSILEKEFYLPTPEVLAAQSKNNKQGREGAVDTEQAGEILRLLKADAMHCYTSYEYLLNDDGNGKPVDPGRIMLARELARMNLPVNFYTQAVWKIDLHNLMHFLSLRNDPHAQFEIRVYAELMWDVVREWVPAAAAAFKNVHMDGVKLTGYQLKLVQDLLRGTGFGSSHAGMTTRANIDSLDYEWAKTVSPEIGRREFEEMKTAVTKGL